MRCKIGVSEKIKLCNIRKRKLSNKVFFLFLSPWLLCILNEQLKFSMENKEMR